MYQAELIYDLWLGMDEYIFVQSPKSALQNKLKRRKNIYTSL